MGIWRSELGALAEPFYERTIGINRKIPHRKEGTNLAILGFFRRRPQTIGIRSGLSGSAKLGDSNDRKTDTLREKSLHRNPARHGLDRRDVRRACERNSSKMASKLPQNHGNRSASVGRANRGTMLRYLLALLARLERAAGPALQLIP
jgi:hypothetical protein